MNTDLRIGRIVHFKVPRDRCYPAIVTRVVDPQRVDLHVFGCPGWERIPVVKHGEWTEGKRWHWGQEHFVDAEAPLEEAIVS